jgi:uncharacterized protein (DUF983 family)
LGLLCGACGSGTNVNTTNKTFFVCRSCGEKFKTPEQEREDINRAIVGLSVGLLIGIGLVVLSVWSLSEGEDDAGWMFLIGLGTIVGCILGIKYCYDKKP